MKAISHCCNPPVYCILARRKGSGFHVIKSVQNFSDGTFIGTSTNTNTMPFPNSMQGARSSSVGRMRRRTIFAHEEARNVVLRRDWAEDR